MKSKLYFIFYLLPLWPVAQQKLPVDTAGHITDSVAVKELLRNQKYQLIGDFMPTSGKPGVKLAKVFKNGLQGYIDLYGNEVVKPRYAGLETFLDGTAIAVISTGYRNSYSILNLKGETVAKDMSFVKRLTHGLFFGRQANGHFLIDATGKQVPVFAYNQMFGADGIIMGRQEKRYAASHLPITQHYYDKQVLTIVNQETGQETGEDYWDIVTWEGAGFRPGSALLVAVQKDGYFLIDRLGYKKAGPFAQILQLSDDYFMATHLGKSALINQKGVVVKDFGDCSLIADKEDLFKMPKVRVGKYFVPKDSPAYKKYQSKINLKTVYQDGLHGYKNGSGDWVSLPVLQQSKGNFTDGLSIEKKNGKWGVINLDGRVVVPFAYDDITRWPSGFVVSNQRKFGFIDFGGKVRIKPQYQEMWMNNGFLMAKQMGKTGIVSFRNRILMPFLYEEVYPSKNGYAQAGGPDHYGVVDFSGQVCVPLQFDSVELFDDTLPKGIFRVSKAGKAFMADRYGNIVGEPSED